MPKNNEIPIACTPTWCRISNSQRNLGQNSTFFLSPSYLLCFCCLGCPNEGAAGLFRTQFNWTRANLTNLHAEISYHLVAAEGVKSVNLFVSPGTTEGTLPSPFRSAEGQPKGAPARSLARPHSPFPRRRPP